MYWKAQFEIFDNLLTALWTVPNTYAQVARAQSCANHVQHIEHLSHATCCVKSLSYEVPHGTKAQLSYLVWQELKFIWALFHILNHWPMKEGRKPQHPEKSPGNKVQNMPYTKAGRFMPQARLKPAQYHWWQTRKADMQTITVFVYHMLHANCYTTFYVHVFIFGNTDDTIPFRFNKDLN